MSTGITRAIGTSSIPIWQEGNNIQFAQGGFTLNVTGLPTDSIIPAGSPVIFDEASRTATIVGGASLQAAATGNPLTYRVNKGGTLKVGDNAALVTGGPAEPITAIDTSNDAYDVITVGVSLGNAVVGANVFASTTAGATAAALGAVNGLLYDDTLGNPGETVSVVICGTVYARRIPFGYSAALAALPGLDDIIFSQSR